MTLPQYSDRGPIGVFDSGYGGLTVFKEIVKRLPQYDYIYLGDNARAPYGSRSFDVVYRYTVQAVRRLFELGCPLVILACNTASAKALRNIQKLDLPQLDPSRRVLGVIRPCVETIGEFTKTGHIGILATQGTVISNSYPLASISHKLAKGKREKWSKNAHPWAFFSALSHCRGPIEPQQSVSYKSGGKPPDLQVHPCTWRLDFSHAVRNPG